MIRASHLRLTLALMVGAACSGEQNATARISGPASATASSSSTGATLVVCPTGAAQTTSGLIGPLGGILAVGNTRVLFPANAVLAPTSFTLTVPASKYVEIEVKAAGTDHFLFALPVAVTIDYGRCSRSNFDNTVLTAWNIDPVTKELLELMVGVDDKRARAVTFTTIHFSGYAVAD